MPRFQDRNLDPASSFPTRQFNAPIVTAISLTKRAFWIHKFPKAVKVLGASVFASAYTATVTVLGYITSGNEPLSQITIAVDAVPEKWKTTTVGRHIRAATGAMIEKAVVTAQLFSAAHTINVAAVGQKWGVILIQQTITDGAYTTKVITADQAYASEANALAAAAGVAPDAGKMIVAAISIQSKNATAWTANTDDMTAASDVAAVNFYATAANAASGSYNDAAFSITPVALTEVAEDTFTDTIVRENQFLVLAFTTDGAGVLTNGNAIIDVRAWPLRGDSLVGT